MKKLIIYCLCLKDNFFKNLLCKLRKKEHDIIFLDLVLIDSKKKTLQIKHMPILIKKIVI